MFLKKQIIKNYLKVQLIGQEPGLLKIRIPNLRNVDQEFQGFEADIKDLVKILPGIEEITTDFETGDIDIYYNPDVLTARQVAMWVNTVIDTAVNYFDFIKNNWQKNPQLVKNTLEQKLKQKIR